MSETFFDPHDIRVSVPVVLSGPLREIKLSFSLDTGATRTTLRPKWLREIGVDLTRPIGSVRVRGVTGERTCPTFTLPAISALDRTKRGLIVIANDFPSSVSIDGLLGLDFFRNRVLALDFIRGLITLRPPRPFWRFW